MKKIETISDVFEWVDASLHTWIFLHVGENNTFSDTIFETKPVKNGICDDPEYVLEAKICIHVLNKVICLMPAQNLHYVFKRLFRNAYLFFENLPKETPEPLFFDAYKIDGLICATYWDLYVFYGEINQICTEFGCDISRYCEYELPTLAWTRPAQSANDCSTIINYNSMKPTHRRAAVWGLIDKMGLRKSVDKTNLAAFVEAVTGGNITAKPQDTVSYKEPTEEAKKAAAEWLKKIGIK